MNKFENVDVLASLQQIMQQNTAAFQNDFDIDKKILTQAAKSKNAEDKVYLWFSRPNGTHCLRERDVFLRGTREHNTFRFYHEQTKERVLAYAVVLSGMESGKVKGSIYELDYAAKAELAIQTALRTDNNRLIYEKGSRELPKEYRFEATPDREYGKFVRYEAVPHDPEALRDLRLFMFEHVYRNPVAKGEEVKAKAMLEQMYYFYMDHIEQLPAKLLKMLDEGEDKGRIVCDYISGMTDKYAITKFKENFMPQAWKVDGY